MSKNTEWKNCMSFWLSLHSVQNMTRSFAHSIHSTGTTCSLAIWWPFWQTVPGSRLCLPIGFSTVWGFRDLLGVWDVPAEDKGRDTVLLTFPFLLSHLQMETLTVFHIALPARAAATTLFHFQGPPFLPLSLCLGRASVCPTWPSRTNFPQRQDSPLYNPSSQQRAWHMCVLIYGSRLIVMSHEHL